MVREAINPARLERMGADEAAAFWIMHRQEGLTPQEEVVFRTWLAASEENARAWANADAAMRCFDGAEDDEILRGMRSHALASKGSTWFRPHYAAAAALILLLFASAWIFFPGLTGGGGDPALRVAESTASHSTGPGEMKRVRLPDGSRMTVDPQSAVELRFTSSERSLRLLRGRAYFDAVRDSERPFSVSAGTHRVVALGTRFDVRLSGGELNVTLIEGRVAVSAAGSGTPIAVLQPGQQFVAAGGTARVRPAQVHSDAPPEQASEASASFVTFDDEPLSTAIAEINRGSARQLVVRDPAVAALRVTGRFRRGDAERFARALATVHQVRVVRRGPDGLELLPRR